MKREGLLACLVALFVHYGEGQPPDGWTCEASKVGDGFCNCGECGVYDPDCDAISNWLKTSCPALESCRSDTNECWPVYVPNSWTCEFSRYMDGSVCDCECGASDPDCGNAILVKCHDSGEKGGSDEFRCPDTLRCEAVPEESDGELSRVVLIVVSVLFALCAAYVEAKATMKMQDGGQDHCCCHEHSDDGQDHCCCHEHSDDGQDHCCCHDHSDDGHCVNEGDCNCQSDDDITDVAVQPDRVSVVLAIAPTKEPR